MGTSEISDFLEQYHSALEEIINGRPALYQSLYARRDDVTLANPFAPFGPVSRGYAQVSETIARAAQNYIEGRVLGFENIATCLTAELGYIVEVERFEATVRGKEERSPLALRVTTIVRREDTDWKIAHRHADAITSPRPATSLLPHR
ncbi:MAG TPA: nuclear transport factor 2 family protein [Vicinamibacterales bacterium]|nr:nuclear transport factor 2 family protein [Vicinamibacterales bacterium]